MAKPAFLRLINHLPCQEEVIKHLHDYYDWLRYEKNYSEHTQRGYLSELRFFLLFLAEHTGQKISLTLLSECRLTEFRSYVAKRAAKGSSNTSRARSISSLKNFYGWLDKQGILHNPQIELMTAPKKPKSLPKTIEMDKLFQILSELRTGQNKEDWQNLRDVALFTLLYGTGLRIAEALSLNVGDLYDRENQDHVIVMGKRKKQRHVPLIPVVKESLFFYKESCPEIGINKEDPFFIGARGGRLHAGLPQRAIKQLRRQLQMPESITPHAFRHSFASHLLNKGVNLRIIQELLGHASLTSTQIYTELSLDHIMSVHERCHPRNNK